jgi:hypothetical protein
LCYLQLQVPNPKRSQHTHWDAAPTHATQWEVASIAGEEKLNISKPAKVYEQADAADEPSPSSLKARTEPVLDYQRLTTAFSAAVSSIIPKTTVSARGEPDRLAYQQREDDLRAANHKRREKREDQKAELFKTVLASNETFTKQALADAKEVQLAQSGHSSTLARVLPRNPSTALSESRSTVGSRDPNTILQQEVDHSLTIELLGPRL